MTTFISVPYGDVTRAVSFTINTENIEKLVRGFIDAWNDPFHGHVFTMEPAVAQEDEYVSLMNMSNEPMILVANKPYHGSYIIGQWEANEIRNVHMTAFIANSVEQTYPFVTVLQDTPVFKFTAYLHRKKSDQPYYVREDIISLPKGVYVGIGNVAATLNQNITMRGERNGFIVHFVTRGGKLCVEASHKQPEPSFVEIVPLHIGLGLVEQDVVRLRTKERLDFPYAPCCLI